MDFVVLGPIQVRDGAQVLPPGSARERIVLAILLLNAGRLTPADRLMDALWDEPPPSARAQLHNLISRWRRRLCADPRLIVSRPLGYELRLGSHRLDVLEFRRLVADGRQAAERGEHELAVATLSEALSWWRGPALADVGDEFAVGPRQALEAEKVAAVEARLDSALALARYHDVLSELPSLISDHPYRERLYQTQMLALVGVGRRADALATYRQLHRRLADDLGVEPGPSLRELELQILRGDAHIAAPAAARQVVPRQLPPVTGILTGRDKLICEISAALRQCEDGSPVVLLVGPGGVGKTTLALAVSYGLGDAFPDGQLYTDLRGSHEAPADPHAVIGQFLRALGVDGANVPDDRDERVAMYRSHLAGRRALVVLDDAASEEQVRPLLPGAARCGAVISSRRRLDALVAASRWTVPVLAPSDALELLTKIVGRERVAAEVTAAAAVLRLCGHLPLAASIVAARLAARPDWTLAEFRQRLAEERGRLDELAVGDLDVRASIALSYQALGPELRRLFRRLGLVAAPDWPIWVAQELLGAPADRLVDQLIDVHLVEPNGRDAAGQHRFRLHDLVADFAHELAAAEEHPRERLAAQTRTLHGWLALATEADERIGHGLIAAAGLPAPAPPAGAQRPALAAPQDWFDAERANLTVAVDQACHLGQAELAGRLALRASGFLALRAHYDDWEYVLRTATACVRAHGSDELFLRLLDALCVVCRQRSRNAEVAKLAAEQLALARRLGDRQREVGALGNAGWAARKRGRLAEATDWLEQAVAACGPETPNRLVSRALNGLAMLYREVDQHVRALPLVERALAIERQEGNPRIVVICLQNHAMTLLDAGRSADAERALAEAMVIAGEIGDEQSSAMIEQMLAEVEINRGHWSAAAKLLDRSLRSAERRGDLTTVAEIMRIMGELAFGRGMPQAAFEPLQRSLAIWRRLDAPVEVARILARLDLACGAAGNHAAAAEHRQEWRAILADLQLDEACLRCSYAGAAPGSNS